MEVSSKNALCMTFYHLVEVKPLCTLSHAIYDAMAVFRRNSWKCCSCGIVGSSVALLVVGTRPLSFAGVREALLKCAAGGSDAPPCDVGGVGYECLRYLIVSLSFNFKEDCLSCNHRILYPACTLY